MFSVRVAPPAQVFCRGAWICLNVRRSCCNISDLITLQFDAHDGTTLRSDLAALLTCGMQRCGPTGHVKELYQPAEGHCSRSGIDSNVDWNSAQPAGQDSKLSDAANPECRSGAVGEWGCSVADRDVTSRV